MKSAILFTDFYVVHKICMYFMGLWPGCEENRWRIFYIFQKWISSFAVAILLVISLILHLCLQVDSLEQLADASYYVTTQLSYVMKLILFWRKRNIFRQIVINRNDLAKEEAFCGKHTSLN